jgi:hypothetical protein
LENAKAIILEQKLWITCLCTFNASCWCRLIDTCFPIIAYYKHTSYFIWCTYCAVIAGCRHNFSLIILVQQKLWITCLCTFNASCWCRLIDFVNERLQRDKIKEIFVKLTFATNIVYCTNAVHLFINSFFFRLFVSKSYKQVHDRTVYDGSVYFRYLSTWYLSQLDCMSYMATDDL